MINKKDKRGDIPLVILVIGIMLICALALFSFSSSMTKVRNSFLGIGLIENMNSQIEKNYFLTKEFEHADGLTEFNNYLEINGKGKIFELETAEQFPFVKRKDKFLFSVKFLDNNP